MLVLYTWVIRVYGYGIIITSLFNNKAKKWVNGRKWQFQKLNDAFKDNSAPVAWFHCASAGEFEQGAPLMEAIRHTYPKYKILVTFFSSSGFEAKKNERMTDYVFYLPLDTPANARIFTAIVKPKVVFFIKYEFWYNFLACLYNENIPFYLVSAKFRKEQIFFKKGGSWFRNFMTKYKLIFVQDEESLTLLREFGINNVLLTGDTRIDRVISNSEIQYKNEIIVAFKNSKLMWICGSTWETDEDLIVDAFNLLESSIKLIIVPHEINSARIKKLKNKFRNGIIYSEASIETVLNVNVMIVDRMGILSSLYRYGNIAYIGGGFDKGIHSVLEAAVYGVPVLFGPNFKKFKEAVDLINCGGALSINSSEELIAAMKKVVSENEFRNKMGESSLKYVKSVTGATGRIMEAIKPRLDL